MRPGRPEDLASIVELFRHEVEIGRQDAAPSGGNWNTLVEGNVTIIPPVTRTIP